MKKILFWINNARNIALPQSLLPTILAIAMASNIEGFSWGIALLSVFGVVLAHLGMNLADDYFDYKKDSRDRRELTSKGMRVRIAKCHYLTEGLATVSQLRNAIIVFLLMAIGIGSIIFWQRGINILYITLIGGLLGISYSGYPFRFSYWGLGELIIGTIFGPLLMIGVYFASSGSLDFHTLLVSIPVGFLVTNIVYSHSVMDSEADREIEKMTFARLLKSKANMLFWSGCCNFLPFIIILMGVILGYLHWAYMFCFITFPMAVYLFLSIRRFLYNEQTDFKPKKWMGPMPNWENYEKAGIDWFMLRWLLARNLVSFFCLILTIVNFIL